MGKVGPNEDPYMHAILESVHGAKVVGHRVLKYDVWGNGNYHPRNQPVLILEMPDGQRVWMAVYQDPEGNGPGHVMVYREEDALALEEGR